jgi:DNA repair exonuclease SbcCD ATPase subunit
MKMLVIEWQRLLDERNRTCPRCGSTEQQVEKAVQSLKQVLNSAGIDVSLVKKAIDPERFRKNVLQSNKILIAGKTLEAWLGAGTGQSRCCEVCGDAECRTVEFADRTYETIPADLIVKAGLLAASQVFNVKLPRSDQRKSAMRILPKGCCE